jgi:hypothetical protein
MAKLKITPCILDANGNVTGQENDDAFEVRINPADYTSKFEISYNDRQPMGGNALQPKFNSAGEREFELDIVMDGTGVVPPTSPNSTGIDVNSQLEDLKNVVYKVVGKEHQPNTVMLVWGSYKFVGRLTTMDVQYTLFKPSGVPLRAKIKMKFKQYVGPTEAANSVSKTSPDLTHSIDVRAGDTLPLLCFRIYKNSAYYLEVAKFNGITNFRNLRPGTRLSFPPLR